MMKDIKKLSGYFVRYILVLSIIGLCFMEPLVVSAATDKQNTLRGLRAELSELKAKKQANANKKNLTQSEINSKNNAINDSYAKISESENRISEAKGLIEVTGKKIDELKEKNKELMAYFQIMQGENSYVEFIADASSMTELIMRSDAVSKLAEYQQKKVLELNDLIEENEQLQVDLINYEEELKNNISSYQKTVISLQDDLASLNEIGMDIDDEIRSKQELIKAYEQMGCKEDEDLDACAAVAGNVKWLKPLAKGRINSIFGVRTDPFTGKKKVHQAVDIGGNAEGTNVYAVGNGVIIGMVDAISKYKSTGKKTCGGNQIYLQLVVAGKTYVVQYAHLLKVNVKVGQKVSATTIVGQQGGGSATKKWESCSTGTHLHFGVAQGTPKKNQSLYSFFVSHVIVPPGFPGKGAWFYSR